MKLSYVHIMNMAEISGAHTVILVYHITELYKSVASVKDHVGNLFVFWCVLCMCLCYDLRVGATYD